MLSNGFIQSLTTGISQISFTLSESEIQLTTGDPASAVQFIQSEQVDLALAGKPNNLPTGLEFYKIDDISLSLIAPRVACLATQLLQEEPINLIKFQSCR